ncbi:hypothetical protein [Methanimicrococcus blatticola]|uniref:hypothetical protein n=1 Tax=Methanimicrococcus blatticola TaxID=91560 RepID=UPI00105DCE02|nr:hypothetical protein [Methanimicrococcus blatticola]MBZ3935851.1 hypothetical protein [Methanimicrococcus blatticola]MCC2508028.1 hypothetical protein [Methanimicrococcus blatticola]
MPLASAFYHTRSLTRTEAPLPAVCVVVCCCLRCLLLPVAVCTACCCHRAVTAPSHNRAADARAAPLFIKYSAYPRL